MGVAQCGDVLRWVHGGFLLHNVSPCRGEVFSGRGPELNGPRASLCPSPIPPHRRQIGNISLRWGVLSQKRPLRHATCMLCAKGVLAGRQNERARASRLARESL